MKGDQIEDYLTELLEPKQHWVLELEDYAEENKVPIMEPLGMDFLMQLLRVKRPKKILEIGTAIGYSALRMVEAYPETSIVTIERDESRYREAVKNIEKIDKENKIHVMFGDALEMTSKIKAEGPFDLLFIDAAKGQYQRFFELYSPYLTDDAIIVSDNVLFRGLVADNTLGNERLEKIAKKLRTYNEWLINHPTFKTMIVPVGDGIAITTKR